MEGLRGARGRVEGEEPSAGHPWPVLRTPVFQELIREGCLHKLTRKGLQQRMFFLVGRRVPSRQG